MIACYEGLDLLELPIDRSDDTAKASTQLHLRTLVITYGVGNKESWVARMSFDDIDLLFDDEYWQPKSLAKKQKELNAQLRQVTPHLMELVSDVELAFTKMSEQPANPRLTTQKSAQQFNSTLPMPIYKGVKHVQVQPNASTYTKHRDHTLVLKYSWQDEGNRVKIGVPFDHLSDISENRISMKNDEQSLLLTIVDSNGMNA